MKLKVDVEDRASGLAVFEGRPVNSSTALWQPPTITFSPNPTHHEHKHATLIAKASVSNREGMRSRSLTALGNPILHRERSYLTHESAQHSYSPHHRLIYIYYLRCDLSAELPNFDKLTAGACCAACSVHTGKEAVYCSRYTSDPAVTTLLRLD